jgi:hypothetical protein
MIAEDEMEDETLVKVNQVSRNDHDERIKTREKKMLNYMQRHVTHGKLL